MGKIRIAVVGLGNCASALIQGIEYYKNTDEDPIGLMHEEMGGYRVADLEVVAAFDVDARKVGRDVSEAVSALPNCTKTFYPDLPESGVMVEMGPVLDGVSEHMKEYPEESSFVVAEAEPVDVAETLKDSGADILVNYLPVGSEKAARLYAQSALQADCGLVNCIPVFIASDPSWGQRFEEARLPVVGDDIKSQIGATVVHRTLAKLFSDRGAVIDRTYQLNTGGNTDFLNMLNRSRLKSKKVSKTEAVQAQLPVPLEPENIHIGPSDYVPWQKDNKICFLRIEGRIWGNVPIDLELRLSVEDSPNSAGSAIDAIRCAKIALDRGIGGPLAAISAYTMKHPPVQIPEEEARRRLEEFIRGEVSEVAVDEGIDIGSWDGEEIILE
ncbi:MAG: inositol-3-phosphate synthase [Thermoplasmata archaeon]